MSNFISSVYKSLFVLIKLFGLDQMACPFYSCWGVRADDIFFGLHQTAFPQHLYIIIRRPTPTLDFKYKAVTELIAYISISSSDGADHSKEPTVLILNRVILIKTNQISRHVILGNVWSSQVKYSQEGLAPTTTKQTST